MAATGTQTPNIGLRIPQGTDPASVDDINYNSNLLDTKLGAVGNDSVQDQIDSLNDNLTQVDTSVTGLRCTKTGTIASVLLNAGGNIVTISTDGKTLNQIIPSSFRPQRDMKLAGKVYNGSSYVDCLILINTSGQIVITTLFGSVISGLSPGYIYPGILVYQIA